MKQENFEQYADEITAALTPFAAFAPFARENRPPFPTEKLPPVVGDMVTCLAEATQTPEEMAGLLSLGVLATLFQSRFRVEVNSDWKEPLCLYCVAVASPGERKSSVLNALTEPIYKYEEEQQELDAEEIAQNRTEREILEGNLQKAKQVAMKDPSGRQRAIELASELANFKDLQEQRWLVDDTTPEKLAEMLSRQKGCLTVCSSEGGVFEIMQGRYDKAGSLDVYLKAHAGDPIVVDRITRGTNYIRSPRLTMLLTIQPEVLTGLMSNSSFRGRGLCGRFLYAVCDSRVGYRKVSPEPVPYEVRENYRAFIRRSLSAPYQGVIHLSPEADEIREAYQAYVEGLLGGQWDSMRDWGGKLVGGDDPHCSADALRADHRRPDRDRHQPTDHGRRGDDCRVSGCARGACLPGDGSRQRGGRCEVSAEEDRGLRSGQQAGPVYQLQRSFPQHGWDGTGDPAAHQSRLPCRDREDHRRPAVKNSPCESARKSRKSRKSPGRGVGGLNHPR